MHILVVEDERRVAQAIETGLKKEGYDVTLAENGEEGFFKANERPCDLILLDVNLPGRSGLDVLSLLRQKGSKTPVLILTARDALEDRIIGLDSGADDYLVKPFAFPELLARTRALLRRGKNEASLLLKAADLELDVMSREVRRTGRKLDLTLREFELLECLLKHQGQLVSREMLARDVWKETSRATPLDNVIDVHMARLRKKVDQDQARKLIHTLRGVGFILREEH
ncbi:MAG TPA: response regulator transcription factor [Bdellovibrionota bacterium]|nr:response regulator transcription factor [Bdellovibrionota bacterium]